MCYRKGGGKFARGSVELPTLFCHAFKTHVVTWPPLPLSPRVIPDCLCVFTATDLFSTSGAFPCCHLCSIRQQVVIFLSFSIRDSHITHAPMVLFSRCHGTAYGWGRRFFIVKDSGEKQFWREDLFSPEDSVHGPLVPCFCVCGKVDHPDGDSPVKPSGSPHWRLEADGETGRVSLLPSLLCSSSLSASFSILYLLQCCGLNPG